MSACTALASVAVLGLGATPAGAAGSASTARSGSTARPGDRANVGAPHSPRLLRQLASQSRMVRLAGTRDLAPAATAAAALAGAEQGVDVASFQHPKTTQYPKGSPINWAQVAASGIRFAAVKATEGAYYQNPYALSDLAGAQAAHLSTVAYAFAIPNGNGSSADPAAQADYLLNYLGSYASTVPIMLDIEYNPYGAECYGLSATAMVSWVSAFNAEIQAKTGRQPVIYTTPGWWQDCTGGSSAFSQVPLWVADYSSTSSPTLPAGWTNWTLWQYTSGGTVTGIATAKGTDLDQALALVKPAYRQQAVGDPVDFAVQPARAPAFLGQTLSYTATGLPPGVAMTSGGVISGWLTHTGSYSVKITASDAAGAVGYVKFTWKVSPAVSQGPTGPVRFDVAGRCLTDRGNSSANGAGVTISACNGSAAQKWVAVQDRTLRIHGKCLSVSGSAKQSGAKEVLEPCAGYASQQWTVSTGAHLVNGAGGLCLSGSASGVNGSRVWLGRCATGASRAWTLPAAPVRSQLPGQCAASSSQAGGTVVQIAPCGGPGQQWTAQPDGTVQQAGQCLEVAGAATASGTGVDLASCTGGPGQQWQINPVGAGQQLENPHSGLCLADPSDSTASGTQLVIASCTGGDPGTGWRLP